MKSKFTKIQILKKGMAIILSAMFLATPITYATTSLDDSYLESSVLDQVLYGTIGSTVKEIEEWFESGKTTLYITNETQLRAFAEYVNNGNDCSGKEIVLLNDIELDKNTDWTPIKSFKGTFNGNNKKIINVRYSGHDKILYELNCVGFFKALHGTVKNLTLENVAIDVTNINAAEEDYSDISYTGGIAGYDYGTIENCTVTGRIKGIQYVGGIAGGVGDQGGIIERCTNNAEVEAVYDHAGGIAGGCYEGTISYCLNNGKISGGEYVGGILGADVSRTQLSSCINKGDVEGYDYIGGIIGAIDQGIAIFDLKNEGDITGYNYVGGIIGLNYGDLQNVTNTGKIKGYDCVGGIAGQSDGSIGFCINTGIVEGDTNKGNIAGKIHDVSGEGIDGATVIESNIGAGLGNTATQTVDSTKDLTATYELPTGYYKSGETINVEVTFNKKLYTALGTSNVLINENTAPKLIMTVIGDNDVEKTYELNNGEPSVNGNNTKINYQLTITDDMLNGKVESLNLNSNITYYAIEGSIPTDTTTYSNYKITSIDRTLDVSDNGIYIDTVKPTINTRVYVDNMLETERYTAGKEIIFEVTTNEQIKGTYTTPEIKVSFSESGVGKYNYNEEKGAGFAKCTNAVINLDGTTTWTYSYQIQEFDEGQVEFEYTVGQIEDLAGNVTNIEDLYTPNTDITSEAITGTEWNSDLGVTYEFYKNSVSEANKVTSQTYFTDADDLIVVATFDKVLYVHYGLSDGKNTNIRLNNTYKDRAPSLYLNGDSVLEQSSIEKVTTTNYVESNSTSGTTTVQYRFKDIAKDYGLKTLTQVEKLVLKNENNEETVSLYDGTTTVSTNGLIPYAEKYYSTYKDEEEDLYNKTLTSGKTKTTSGFDDVLVDPVGVSTKIDKSNIYADTTAPTLTITADESNPTNADLITYTFKFSEVVKGFTADDITVNNGLKVTEEVTIGEEVVEQPKFVEVVEGLEYTLEVKPTITAGNEGTLQVIVEEGACTDLVAINNVRQENNITIDKVVPTVEITADKDYVQANEKIKYTFTWSEQVKEFTEENITVVNGEIVEGTLTKVNDLQYTVEVNPTNGNDVEVSVLSEECTDLAENSNTEAKNIITVIPTVTITTNTSNPTNVSEIEYTFTWSEKVNGFDEKDIILPEGVEGTFEKVNDTTYKMTVNYNSIIPAGNEGEVTVSVVEKAVKDSNGNENAYTTNTLKIDRIAPIFIGLEAHADSTIGLNSEVDIVKEYYKAGDVITIIATFTENIENSTAPALALQFSESGNAKGSIGEPEKIGNQIKYTYQIEDKNNGDNGILSVKGFSGEVKDAAGNKTTVGRKSLDGNTIIADTISPNLTELKVTSTQKANNAGDDITIEAVYNEEVYALITKEDGTKEIVNISNDNAPKLDISFGGVAAKGNMTAKYATKEDGTPDKTRIVYTYKVQGEEEAGDNGELAINKLEDTENSQVCDIAGNTSNNTTNDKYTNGVYADTKKPVVDSITATVDENTDQFIKNTEIYHKAGNEIKITVKFSEDVHAEKLNPRILVGFSEDKEKEPSTYKEVLDLNGTTAERTYSYTIQDGDNGYLWVKVEEEHYADKAGNKNPEDTRRITDNEVFADTTKPTLEIYKDTEVTQNGQKITVKATFSENIYYLSKNTIAEEFETKYAPIIIYGFEGATGNLEQAADSVGEKVITYVITKENTTSGEFYHAYFKGNVYDRAGNECFTNSIDTIAPVLKSVVISSNAGTYNPYCKEGTEIYVTATFDEPIKAENMKLKAKVGEVEIADLLDGQIVKEDPKQVKFTYKVNKGDMGEFTIVDICGEPATEDKEDYGWVEDKHGNRKEIYNLEGIKPTGNAIADTENPYIESVKAIINGKDEVATYPKEEGKAETARVNVNDIEYVVTFNELVKIINESEIKIYNGEKVEIINNDSDEDGYYDQITIKARTTIEGVQSLIISDNAIEDRAGNTNLLERFNIVTTDFTKPTVRFISEYNGGVYVLPTNVEKIELRPNVEISEDIAKIEFKWAKINENGEWEDIAPYAEVKEFSSLSDIIIDTQAFGEGDYKLFIKVVDLAGNVYETTEESAKEYNIKNSNIIIYAENEGVEENAENKLAPINGNVLVTVTFKEGLTDNRKVIFKAEGSTESKELKIDENGNLIVDENGTIYAEATDRVGNKVFTEYKVENIDKDAPEITFNEIPYEILKGESLEINIYTNESAIISYSWDNQTWENTTEYVYSKDLTKAFEEAGTYTLYVKAKDKAGNESSNQLSINVTNLDFEVWGNVENWTSGDVELYVSYEGELASIKVNETSIDAEERIYVAKENGDYVFVITDKYGNTATKTVKVEKIDKDSPVIENVTVNGKEITITAKDDKSGIAEYAITNTSEEPVEWSESNVIKVTEDGKFYVWVKDNVGNVTRDENSVVIDTTAPTITFSYTSLTVTVGVPMETNIVTSEDAIISYSWDKETWVDSEELLTSLKVSEKSATTGEYTLYVKAKDNSGNESKVQTLEFNVVNVEEIRQPEIIFEDIPTIQINGVKYVKVSSDMTAQGLTNKMDQEALCGKTPEYIKLTEDKDLKTGSEIAINGSTKYIVVVEGDINCDGEVTFDDIIKTNAVRISAAEDSITKAQLLAVDINNTAKIEFKDIISINAIRINSAS